MSFSLSKKERIITQNNKDEPHTQIFDTVPPIIPYERDQGPHENLHARHLISHMGGLPFLFFLISF